MTEPAAAEPEPAAAEPEPAAAEPEPAPHSVRMDRRAARVLVLDDAGRVLLMRGIDPAAPDVPRWFTVGGGVEDGEDFAEGALRELFEETGLRLDVDALVGPFHQDVARFGFAQYWIEQPQQYFLVRVPSGWQPRPAALEEIEAATVDRWSWWTLDDLRDHAAGRPNPGPGTLGEPVYPLDLPELLARALTLP